MKHRKVAVPTANLTADQVREMFSLAAQDLSFAEIARKMDSTYWIVRAVLSRNARPEVVIDPEMLAVANENIKKHSVSPDKIPPRKKRVKTVDLSDTQLKLAKKLGLTKEQYVAGVKKAMIESRAKAKSKLTATQKRLAERLGFTPEQYASFLSGKTVYLTPEQSAKYRYLPPAYSSASVGKIETRKHGYTFPEEQTEQPLVAPVPETAVAVLLDFIDKSAVFLAAADQYQKAREALVNTGGSKQTADLLFHYAQRVKVA